MRNLWDWLRRYWIAVAVSLGFTAAGLLYSIPPNYDQPYQSYLYSRWLIAFTLLGPLAFSAESYYQTISPFPHYYQYDRFYAYILNQSNFQLNTAVLLILTSGIIGILLWWLLKTRKTRRLLIWLLSINYGLVFGLTAVRILQYGDRGAEFVPFYSLKNECVVEVTNQVSIRVLYFDSKKPSEMNLAGIPRLREEAYLISYNEGGEWREFMHLADTLASGSCDQIHALNDDFIWLWEWGMLVISEDGGNTWRVWDTSQLGGEYADWNFDKQDSHIVDVVFEDELNGQMRLGYFDIATQTRPAFNLVTEDGGLTWLFTEET